MDRLRRSDERATDPRRRHHRREPPRRRLALRLARREQRPVRHPRRDRRHTGKTAGFASARGRALPGRAVSEHRLTTISRRLVTSPGACACFCNLGNVTYMTLPNDHTFGVSPSNPTPETFCAVNDEATGMFIDGLSHSPLWATSLVMITEDDPSQGGEHVDNHRAPFVIVSPFVKRGYVSHTHIDVASMHKILANVIGKPYPNALVAARRASVRRVHLDAGLHAVHVHAAHVAARVRREGTRRGRLALGALGFVRRGQPARARRASDAMDARAPARVDAGGGALARAGDPGAAALMDREDGAPTLARSRLVRVRVRRTQRARYIR